MTSVDKTVCGHISKSTLIISSGDFYCDLLFFLFWFIFPSLHVGLLCHTLVVRGFELHVKAMFEEQATINTFQQHIFTCVHVHSIYFSVAYIPHWFQSFNPNCFIIYSQSQANPLFPSAMLPPFALDGFMLKDGIENQFSLCPFTS